MPLHITHVDDPGRTDIQVAVQSVAARTWLDFADKALRATPGTRWAAMPEDTSVPGLYTLDIAGLTALPDGEYVAVVTDTAGIQLGPGVAALVGGDDAPQVLGGGAGGGILLSDLDATLDARLVDPTHLGRLDVAVSTVGGGPTPAGSGDGSIAVGSDYGGIDALSYRTAGGAGIDDAAVRAYLASDYTAGRVGESFVVARTATDAAGRLVAPLLLDPGSYVLLYSKQGAYGPDTLNLTVS